MKGPCSACDGWHSKDLACVGGGPTPGGGDGGGPLPLSPQPTATPPPARKRIQDLSREELVAALDFYGKRSHYLPDGNGGSEISRDNGARARKALAGLQTNELVQARAAAGG